MPEKLQEDIVKSVSLIHSKHGHKRPVGCRRTHLHIRRTKYWIMNHSTDRTIDKFYIDHRASADHGGFVITTMENSIKSVTGFNRYEFCLKPQETLEFVVSEEATYTSELRTNTSLTAFIKQQAPDLMNEGILEGKTLDAFKAIVRRSEALNALRSLEAGRYLHGSSVSLSLIL